MPRSIGTDFQAQLDSSSLEPFYAVSIGFSPDNLNLWTGYNDITFDSKTFQGSGDLMNISEVIETGEIIASGVKIVISGLPTSVISEVLTENAQGVNVDVYFGVLKTQSNATVVVDTPYKLFGGFIDTMSISEDIGTATITFAVENKLIALERPLDRKYTDQDQKNLFAGDKGLEFVDDIQNKPINWGGGD